MRWNDAGMAQRGVERPARGRRRCTVTAPHAVVAMAVGLGRRGRLAHAAGTAALMFAGLRDGTPRARERIAVELHDELGREPTSEEIHHRLQRTMARAA